MPGPIIGDAVAASVRLGTLLLTLLLMAPTMAHAAEPVVRLVTGTDYPPYVDSTLPNGGLLTVLVQQAFAAAGMQTSLEVEPWRRGYESMLAGRFDATFPYVRTAERDTELLYSDPVQEVRQRMLVTLGQEMAAQEPYWVMGKRVCGAVGYGLPPWLDVLIDQGQVIRVTPTQQRSCIAMIAASRADFMIEDEVISNARLRDMLGADRVATVPGAPADTAFLYLVVAKSNPRAALILTAFNQGLARAKANGRPPA